MEQYKTLNTSLVVALMFAIAFFASVTFASAQEGTNVVDVTVTNVKAVDSTDAVLVKPTTDIRTRNLVDEAKNKRLEVRSDIQDKRTDVRATLQDKRESLRADIQKRSTDARENFSDKKAALDEKRVEAKEKLAQRKEERKEKLAEKAKARIDAYVKRITKRLAAALDRIEKMIDRVDSRITKLEKKFADRNLDLSDSKRLLEVARGEIASARADVSAVEGSVVGALNTDSPKESFAKVRELIKSAVASVKNAHKALVEAVKEVKRSIGSDTGSSDDTTNTDEDNE